MEIKLGWESDWNGDEVGFPEVDVVGLYSLEMACGDELNLYINTETGEVLEAFVSL